MIASIDHLVVAAATLAGGRAWIERRLGVPMSDGGHHEAFGTHNALLSLGTTAYLEVIAIDPDAAPPGRPRWFGLDDPAMRARLAEGPALIHWVARVEELPEGTLDDGREVLALARGENRWRITVSPDGALPRGGVAPSLIQWLTPPPPTRLPELGVRLQTLRLTTPEPDALRKMVQDQGLSDRIVITTGAEPHLGAQLFTRSGVVEL